MENSKNILWSRIKRNKFLLIGILFILLIAFVSIFKLPKVFISSSYYNQYSEKGGIGDAINGISAPFIAIAASILTFLAFWVQFRSNQQQRKQFAKQNQDQLFFKLLEKQESRLVNSSFLLNGSECRSYQLLETISNNFSNTISKAFLPDLAREFIVNYPTLLDNTQLNKMFSLSPSFPLMSNPLDNFDKEKLNFLNEMARLKVNDRYEYIKDYFGSTNYENTAQKETLIEIGSVYFYQIDFNQRAAIYQNAFNQIDHIYGSFLDGYLRGWEFIVQFISESKSKASYSKFLISQTSKYELIILFYYLGSNYASEELGLFIKKNRILQNLYYYNKELIDLPSEEILTTELNYIFSLYTLASEKS